MDAPLGKIFEVSIVDRKSSLMVANILPFQSLMSQLLGISVI